MIIIKFYYNKKLFKTLDLLENANNEFNNLLAHINPLKNSIFK